MTNHLTESANWVWRLSADGRDSS